MIHSGTQRLPIGPPTSLIGEAGRLCILDTSTDTAASSQGMHCGIHVGTVSPCSSAWSTPQQHPRLPPRPHQPVPPAPQGHQSRWHTRFERSAYHAPFQPPTISPCPVAVPTFCPRPFPHPPAPRPRSPIWPVRVPAMRGAR